MLSLRLLSLAVLLLQSCVLTPVQEDAVALAQSQRLAAVLSTVESCAWIVDRTRPTLDIIIVLAGRVPLETCLDAKQP